MGHAKKALTKQRLSHSLPLMGMSRFREVVDGVGLSLLAFSGFKRIHQGFDGQRVESLEVPDHKTLQGSGL